MFLDKYLPKEIEPSLAYKLMSMHVLVIVICNYLVGVKVEMFDHAFRASAFVYPFILVVTDLTIRLLGEKSARATIGLAFIPAIIGAITAQIISHGDIHMAFRVGAASATAYFISTMLDVNVFQYFKEKFSSWWIAPLLSSFFILAFDNYLFFGMAFHAGTDPYMAYNWHEVATNHTISKWIISLAIIMPTYGILLNYLTKKIKSTGTLPTKQFI